MDLKEAFSSRDKYFLPAFLVSLIAISLLAGNFFVVLGIMFVSFQLVSLVYSIVKHRTINLKSIKETNYILAFSVLTSLLLAILLPCIIFHEKFVSPYVIQYAYLAPIMLVFFATLHLYSCLVRGTRPDYLHIAKTILVITLILSFLVSAVFIGATNYLYKQRIDSYASENNRHISRLTNGTIDLQNPDPEIYAELRGYQSELLSEANTENRHFTEEYANRQLCIFKDCAGPMVDNSVYLVKEIVGGLIYENARRAALREYEYILSGDYLANYSSLEQYKASLKKEIDSSNFTPYKLADEDSIFISRLNSGDITYSALKAKMEAQVALMNSQTAGRIASISSPYESPIIDSELGKSLSYAIYHTTAFKDMALVVLEILPYTDKQRKTSDLMEILYNNIDIDESVESKIIRYRLILDGIERSKR